MYCYLGTSDSITTIACSAGTTYSTIDSMGDRLATAASNGFAWIVPDLHGNVAAQCGISGSITDAFRYDAYGNIIGTSTIGSVPSPWRYQGRMLESTAGSDTYDFGARAYVPDLGTFTSLDSVSGTAQNPLTLNRYLYADANPATLVDPDGHRTCAYVSGSDASCDSAEEWRDFETPAPVAKTPAAATKKMPAGPNTPGAPPRVLHPGSPPVWQSACPPGTRADTQEWEGCAAGEGYYVSGSGGSDGIWSTYTDVSDHLHYKYKYQTPEIADPSFTGGTSHMEFTIDYDMGVGPHDSGWMADLTLGGDKSLDAQLPDGLGRVHIDGPTDSEKSRLGFEVSPSYSVTSAAYAPNGDNVETVNGVSSKVDMGPFGVDNTISYDSSTTVSGNNVSIGVSTSSAWAHHQPWDGKVDPVLAAKAAVTAAAWLLQQTKDFCSESPEICEIPAGG
jgi:RHS repeat-associated protein